MARTKSLVSIPTSERVCKRGHIGQYIERKSGDVACGACLDLAQREWRLRNGKKPNQATLLKAAADLRIQQRKLIAQLAQTVAELAVVEFKIERGL